jgi:hypothetical protein
MNTGWRNNERCLGEATRYVGHTVRNTPDGPALIVKFYDDDTGELLGTREIPLTPIARALEFI